ncbi:MAG: ATP-binding cassette domain-containing protein [Oscillospiraceae bacterium]
MYFQYPESQDYALEDVSLTLHPGEKLALVGANGAGKSTLVKLLCGLYHPTKGKILLDGVDVSTLSPEDYFQEFSVVFQEVFAFAFPLSSNVACTPNDQIDEARLRESLPPGRPGRKGGEPAQGGGNLPAPDIGQRGRGAVRWPDAAAHAGPGPIQERVHASPG